jgi:hypothetical protein
MCIALRLQVIPQLWVLVLFVIWILTIVMEIVILVIEIKKAIKMNRVGSRGHDGGGGMSCKGCCNGKYKKPTKCDYYNEKSEICNPENKNVGIEEGLPHKVSEFICVKCGERWLAIMPVGTLLKDLECHKHYVGFVIETGEVMEET